MTSGASVRFWQPAPEVATELVCAYLEAGEASPHLHEEWQFGVLETPSKLSMGAFRLAEWSRQQHEEQRSQLEKGSCE